MTYKIVDKLLTYYNSMHYTYGLSTDKFVTYTINYARYLFRLDSLFYSKSNIPQTVDGGIIFGRIKRI